MPVVVSIRGMPVSGSRKSATESECFLTTSGVQQCTLGASMGKASGSVTTNSTVSSIHSFDAFGRIVTRRYFAPALDAAVGISLLFALSSVTTVSSGRTCAS